jgi:hypothetical protein
MVPLWQGFISILPPEYKPRRAFLCAGPQPEKSSWMVCGVSQTRGMALWAMRRSLRTGHPAGVFPTPFGYHWPDIDWMLDSTYK